MESLTFGTIVLSVGSFLGKFAKIVAGIIILMIAMSAIVPILPDDPFRSDILTISGTFQQWSDFINWFVPTGFIVTSSLFAVECKVFFFVTRLALNYLGANFIQQFGTSELWGSTITYDPDGPETGIH